MPGPLGEGLQGPKVVFIKNLSSFSQNHKMAKIGNFSTKAVTANSVHLKMNIFYVIWNTTQQYMAIKSASANSHIQNRMT